MPQSWYPTDSVPNVPKPKAPACHECNQRLRLVEERVLFPLAFGLDPSDPRAKGVPERARRAITPSLAKTEADRTARYRRRERLQKLYVVSDSDHGALPGFERKQGAARQGALKISERDLYEVAEKLVRVLFWSEYRQYIEPPYMVDMHIARDTAEVNRVDAMIRAGDPVEVPPGIFLYVRRADDDPRGGIAVFDLWGQLRFFGSVGPSAG